jgi:hypothetical protein
MAVTISDMRDFLLDEVAGSPNKVASCTYALPDYTTETYDGVVTAASPECIIGCVMVRHFDVDPLALLDVGQSAMDVLPQMVWNQEFTTDALLLAQVAQRLQDGFNGADGLPWGIAVDRAIAAVYAVVSTWTGVKTREDLEYKSGQSSDLAGVICKSVYAAFGVPSSDG